MSRTVVISTLINRIRRRADIERETDRFPQSELLDEVNASLARLHLILVGVRGADFFEKEALVYATTEAQGTNPPAIVVGGWAEHEGAVVVIRGNLTGPAGVAQVQISQDNGITFGPNVTTTPGTYNVPNSFITVTFPATGTYVGDNGWSSTPALPKTVAGQATMFLPPDFLEMGALAADVNGQKVNVVRYMKNERAFLRETRDWFGLISPFPCYRLRGDRSRDGGECIDFAPVPAGAYEITMFYTPQARTYASETDSIPLDTGHEEWLILDVAIKCREKDDLERASLVARQAQVYEEISKVAEQRDNSMPERVIDRSNDWLPERGWGYGGPRW